MAINKDADNVKRLAEAGILDIGGLTTEGRKAINAIEISDAEIRALTDIKSKLKLDSVKLDHPGSKVWRL
jgi:hypothetical protein